MPVEIGWGTIMSGLGALIVIYFLYSSIRFIPNNRVGIKEKMWSLKGSLKGGGIIALEGEAGFQPDVLRGGITVLPPFMFKIHMLPLVNIPQGKIGYIFARDGQPLSPTQTLAFNVSPNAFVETEAFLREGGQRGPQRQILREGTYAINLHLFVVITQDQVYYNRQGRDEDVIFNQMANQIADRNGFTPLIITEDSVGVVTVHDGPSLAPGEIIAGIVGDDPEHADTYHNNFQDPEKFLKAGGKRGRQYQVLVEGTYYINRLFATVELIPKTVIEVGNVGVVVSYTGDIGADLSGTDYKHGEMVTEGSRGVWSTPLMAGKYAFNTYAGKVIIVPTTNFILKWSRSETGAHKFDENLSEVSLITKDAFEPLLPLSVVVHIDYRKAPLVIQRFGDIKRLVDQTLDPMVAAYFKNTAQTRTLIQLIQDRSSIQQIASEEMKEKFAHYNLELQEVLIGTPASSGKDTRIEEILAQLRSRQMAEEQVETYSRQEKAAVKERELREAESRALQQTKITESELSISIQTNLGKAEYHRAQQQAEQIRALAEGEAAKTRTLAEAEAAKIKTIGEAEADKAARIGIAQAIAIEEQVKAYGGPRFQLTQQVMSRFAEAIEHGGMDVVPRIVIGKNGGEGQGGTGSVMEGLLSMLLAEKLGDAVTSEGSSVRNPRVEAYRAAVRDSMMKVREME
jgi:uncharacterized membrane protein YqiK